MDYRMTCLTAGLARSLNNLLPSNPLMHARVTFCIYSSPHFILPFCFKSELLVSFNKINKKRIIKLRWKTHLKHELKRLKAQASLISKMIAYYMPKSYQSMFNLPDSLFHYALNWRLNRTLLHQICSCGTSFTRSHLSCILSSNKIYLSISNSADFKRKQFILETTLRASHYTVLDHLLNLERFDDFMSLLEVLQTTLSVKETTNSAA